MTEWLNLFTNVSGNITASTDRLILEKKTVRFEKTTSGGFLGIGATTHDTVTILETDRSGAVLINYNQGSSAYGDPEVYLVLERGEREARFLSAPLHTPVKIKGLTRMQLVILTPIGPEGANYHALVNAHCVFDTKMNVDIDGNPWADALDWSW